MLIIVDLFLMFLMSFNIFWYVLICFNIINANANAKINIIINTNMNIGIDINTNNNTSITINNHINITFWVVFKHVLRLGLEVVRFEIRGWQPTQQSTLATMVLIVF